MFGGFLEGYWIDKFGPVAAVHMTTFCCCFCFALMIIYNEIGQFSVFAYFMSFSIGVMDATLVNFLHISLGFEFDSKITPFAS